MKIWNDISNFSAQNPIVTIGSFDGVHLGHKYVLDQLNKIAKNSNGESVVFTFSPHPIKVLAPHKEFVLLTTINEKIELFEKAGIDHLVLFPFTKEFSELSYNDFVKTILIDKLNISTLLTGYDNTIGRNKEGDFNQLIKLSDKYNFKVVRQDELILNNGKLSSTNIRKLLSDGKIIEASKILGYHYILSGKVVHGKKLGNKLGFPTANLMPLENKFIPRNGVYAILVNYNNTTYKGMMNIGVRPTIDDNAPKPIIEAHLFDFKDNLYDEFIKISILIKLRDEYKFNSIDDLRLQLQKDKEFALKTIEEEFRF